MALDSIWVLERQGPCDTLLVFDGRSSSIRATMERKMQNARHVSADIWIVYKPRREAAGRKVVFGSRNREVGWVSFPVARTNVPTQDRKAAKSAGDEWESSTFASTFSCMAPLAWGQLPCQARCLDARASTPGASEKRSSTQTWVARCAGRK